MELRAGCQVTVPKTDSRQFFDGLMLLPRSACSRSRRTASFFGTTTTFASSEVRKLSNESTRNSNFPEFFASSALLLEMSSAPPGLPMPKRIELGPRVNVNREVLYESIGKDAVKKFVESESER